VERRKSGTTAFPGRTGLVLWDDGIDMDERSSKEDETGCHARCCSVRLPADDCMTYRLGRMGMSSHFGIEHGRGADVAVEGGRIIGMMQDIQSNRH